LRRPLLLTVAIALVAAAASSAAPTPLHREVREQGFARVRAGHLTIPPRSTRGTMRVIVRLAAPPLAAWSAARVTASANAAQHLNIHSTASRAYVAQLTRQQDAAVAAVHTAIPKAVVQERYSILLDGFAVRLPANSLPQLLRVKAVTKIYPSLAYYATMDRGPSVIHAGDLQSATGDKGQGVKIAVVDTGVDSTSPFLNPAGFS
jgi:hypothetical protein